MDAPSVFRARLASAVAAGFALSACHSGEQVPLSPPLSAAAHTEASTAASTSRPFEGAPPMQVATTEPTVDAQSSYPSPPPPVVTPAPSPDPVGVAKKTTCDPSQKREHYCLDIGANAPTQIPNPQQPFEANGCVAATAVRNTCTGVAEVLSGPKIEGKKCCYTVCRGMSAPCGRPLVVERGGEARLAQATRRDDWTARPMERPAATEISLARALRDAWLSDATAEHASIAAFSRFALEMLAVGAPASLVEGAHRAALDEIEHARLCFALASAHDDAGAPALGPGALSLTGIALRSSLADVAAAAVEEGCCGETLAALAITRARDLCKATPVIHVLSRIADDEARHAELSWRFVAWALASGGDDVRAAITAAFARGLAQVAASEAVDLGEENDAAVRSAGRLTRGDFNEVVREAGEKVIRPAMESLLLPQTGESFTPGRSYAA